MQKLILLSSFCNDDIHNNINIFYFEDFFLRQNNVQLLSDN